jgi:hypothetical protein
MNHIECACTKGDASAACMRRHQAFALAPMIMNAHTHARRRRWSNVCRVLALSNPSSIIQTRGGGRAGGGDLTSLECLFTITPLPRGLGIALAGRDGRHPHLHVVAQSELRQNREVRVTPFTRAWRTLLAMS